MQDEMFTCPVMLWQMCVSSSIMTMYFVYLKIKNDMQCFHCRMASEFGYLTVLLSNLARNMLKLSCRNISCVPAECLQVML